MGLEIIINVAREETRVAVLDRKVLTDLYIDRVKHRDYVGNVYKGKVVKVLPGLQAAFIDISRRIEKDEERARLKQLMLKLRKPGSGYIVRTVSEGVTDDELRSDVEFLQATWEEIQEKKTRLKAPALLHNDLDLVFRTVRDHFTKEVQHLWVDSKPQYEAVREFVGRYLPELLPRIHLYTKDQPIFDHFDLESEIAKATARKVWLKSGGHIVNDHTEAMTVIDVNTGRFVGKRDLEETITKTNLEAVKEIAYQLKLRSIGGIIIIDFIDMERERNREKVFQALNDALAHDKARTRILRISELGLVEMSRERVREDLYRALSEPCHYCEGRAYTKDPTTICYELFRDIRRLSPTPDERTVVIGAHPNVASLLADEEADSLAEIERERQVKVVVKPDPTLHIEQYDIVML